MYLLKLACILVGNIFGITDTDSVTVHNTALSKVEKQSRREWEIEKEGERKENKVKDVNIYNE